MKDPIERADAIDVVKRLMGDCELSRTVQTGLHILPSAQPDVPDINDGDMISRQAAIRWVKTECNPYGKPTLDFESGKKVIEHLEQMPSIQPDSKESSFTPKALDLIERQAEIDEGSVT